jgi:hypothetical protein
MLKAAFSEETLKHTKIFNCSIHKWQVFVKDEPHTVHPSLLQSKKTAL